MKGWLGNHRGKKGLKILKVETTGQVNTVIYNIIKETQRRSNQN